MPSLPIPMISSFVLTWLLLVMWPRDRRVTPLMVLLGTCAVQGAVISPVAWLGFQTTAVRTAHATDAIHILGPALAVACLIFAPGLLDLLIPALFCAYGAAILVISAKGADALPRLRLSAGEMPRKTWLIIGATLIGSAITDVMIVAAQIAGYVQWKQWIISIYSSGMLMVIGALSLSSDLEAAEDPEDSAVPPEQAQEDQALMARLDTLMESQKLYLNPDLTLTQLSRKLVVPVKQLSGAINRKTGENVSRYVNAARIHAAKTALLEGESVTSAMLTSGFNTKSNFNREFARITGESPSAWLAATKG